jgi:hypothetical protein
MSALALVVCYAQAGSPKFEPAALRWLGRLTEEGRDLSLGDMQLAAAALAALGSRDHEEAEKILIRFL